MSRRGSFGGRCAKKRRFSRGTGHSLLMRQWVGQGASIGHLPESLDISRVILSPPWGTGKLEHHGGHYVGLRPGSSRGTCTA